MFSGAKTMILSKGKNLVTSWIRINHDWILVLFSLLVQIPIAVFLGHYYDDRVLIATGYLVGSGLDPFQPYELVNVFAHPLLQGTIPRFGYPPPGALLTGLAFNLSYRNFPNLFFYNFTLKIPIIVCNVGLAFLVRKIMLELNASEKRAQYAFLFVLFNPFILLTTSAWGQFDTIVALLCVASLYLLIKGETGWCAFTLGLAFSVKPIVLPLLGLPLFFQKPKQRFINTKYLAILATTIFTFYVLPFLVFSWQLPLSAGELAAHFTTAGGLSPFGVVEIFNNTLLLPSSLELLGFLWVPALLIGYYIVYRQGFSSRTKLIQAAIVLVLIFFLTRSWLSEPNINLILPLMLVVISAEKLSFRNFHFAWIIPLFFMFLNYSLPQLFFLLYPSVISDLVALDSHFLLWRLTGKFVLIVLWQIFAWMFVYRMLYRRTRKDYN